MRHKAAPIRKAMVCEARGETVLPIQYCERTTAWMDAHPEDFNPGSREPFCNDNECLRRSLGGVCSASELHDGPEGDPSSIVSRTTGTRLETEPVNDRPFLRSRCV